MFRSLTVAVLAAVLLIVLADACPAALPYPRWREAAAEARRSNRIILCVFKPGEVRPDDTDILNAEVTGWKIFTTLADRQVRQLQARYFVVMVSKMANTESNWEAFAGEVGTQRCLFATPDAVLLTTVPTDARVDKLVECLKAAVARAKELRDAERKAAAEGAAKRRAVKSLIDAAARDVEDWDYLAAFEKLDLAARSAESPDWPEVAEAQRARGKLLKRAESLIKLADNKVAAGKVIPAFRDLDEVVHLYRGMEVAERAKAKLASLIIQDRYTDAMVAYKPEREAYTLYDEALALEKSGDWKGAVEKYAAIAERFKESPVVERADRRARMCKIELARAEREE